MVPRSAPPTSDARMDVPFTYTSGSQLIILAWLFKMASTRFFAVVYGPEYEDIAYYSDREAAFLGLQACSEYSGSILVEYQCQENSKSFKAVKEYAYCRATGQYKERTP